MFRTGTVHLTYAKSAYDQSVSHPEAVTHLATIYLKNATVTVSEKRCETRAKHAAHSTARPVPPDPVHRRGPWRFSDLLDPLRSTYSAYAYARPRPPTSRHVQHEKVSVNDPRAPAAGQRQWWWSGSGRRFTSEVPSRSSRVRTPATWTCGIRRQGVVRSELAGKLCNANALDARMQHTYTYLS